MKTLTILCSGGMIASLLLAGCGGSNLSRTFGFERDAPDEFTVTTRAPLSMPPDFNLPPPQPGAPRPQEMSTTQTAQVTVAGAAALAPAPSAADSPGQDALIAAAGPPPPADIRAKVSAEAADEANSHSLADTLMFWKSPEPKGTVIDSSKEAERLRDNAALGKSPDAGDTPVIQKKNEGLFERLF